MLYLLTATGARPEALALLASYINAQTYTGPMRWLICDDCDPASPVPAVREGIEVEVIRPDWRWRPGVNTQARAMAELLGRVPAGAAAVVCEDDDVYLPEHVATMVTALERAELVGQRVSLYANVATGRCREIPGVCHASLGATALRGAAVAFLGFVCRTRSDRLDMTLWRNYKGRKALLDTRTSIGVKGLPGRGGIGVGHRDNFGDPDPTGEVLVDWIGAERAAAYSGFARA